MSLSAKRSTACCGPLPKAFQSTGDEEWPIRHETRKLGARPAVTDPGGEPGVDFPRRPRPQKPSLTGAAGPSRPDRSPSLILLNFKSCCGDVASSKTRLCNNVGLAAFSWASAGEAAAPGAGAARCGCGTARAPAQARQAPWLVQPCE